MMIFPSENGDNVREKHWLKQEVKKGKSISCKQVYLLRCKSHRDVRQLHGLKKSKDLYKPFQAFNFSVSLYNLNCLLIRQH